MAANNEIEKTLGQLVRGLAHNSADVIYRCHRELYAVGDAALPVIERHLMSDNWNSKNIGLELNIFTGLLGLMNDIDEVKANEVGKKIREKGCSKIVDTRIDSILSFTIKEFELVKIRNVDVYISKEISIPGKVKKKLTEWLTIVPESDLKNIERLYIISEQKEDYRGTYMPVLRSMMVEWDMSTLWFNPLSYLLMIRIEKTFYHEIGHHALKHSFGQDPEQEKEADQYAFRLLGINHPILKKIVRAIKFVFGKKSKEGKEALESELLVDESLNSKQRKTP